MSEAGYPPPEAVQTVAVVGTGVIGAGWAAHFLRMGYDVVAWDPGPGTAERLAAFVGSAWPVLVRLGLGPAASPDRLRFAGCLAEAAGGAEFVDCGCFCDPSGITACIPRYDCGALSQSLFCPYGLSGEDEYGDNCR